MNHKKELFDFLNNYFGHIYLVTIERAKDRHSIIQKELEGLNYEIFFGADFKNFSIDELKETRVYDETLAKQNHRYSKPIKGGMLGCSLSHKMIYEDIIKNKYQRVLVLEDDVIIEQFSFQNFKNAMAELPKNWELLYFDYNKNENKPLLGFLKQTTYHIQKLFGGIKFSHKAINNLFAKKYSNNLMVAGLHDFTDAYAVTTEGAKILLELQTPVQWFPDHLLAYASSNKLINAYCLKEKIISQTSQTSKPEFSLINDNSY
jgi:glycosyl transferase family 25